MGYLIIWIAGSALAGIIASGRGRSFWGFFILSLVISPALGIIAALVVGGDETKVEAKKIESGKARACPYCAELIKPDAIVCKHCGRDVPPPPKAPGEPPKEDLQAVIDLEGYWTVRDLHEYAQKPGYSRAKWLLSRVYAEGRREVSANPEIAAEWLRRSQEEGYDPNAKSEED